MKSERLAEIKKKTEEQVRQEHQRWIDTRNKDIERTAKQLLKRIKTKD